jgi:hypothetical protein
VALAPARAGRAIRMFLCARYPCTCSVAVHAPEGYLVDKKQPKGYLVDKKAPARPGRAISPRRGGVLERLVIYCQTTGASAAHATHCATYCTPCRPLIRAFSGWIRTPPPTGRAISPRRGVLEREFFIDNLLVRVHRCFWCTGLAPWEFESPFPGSLISTFLGGGC